MPKRKKKPLIQEWIAKKEFDIKAAKNGAVILFDPKTALVKYKRKKWNIADLLIFLAEKVEELEDNQCTPNAGCIFEGQQYMDDKYISGSLIYDK